MHLSERETSIAEQYAQGLTYKEIAADLRIAPSTVRNHLAAVYKKLQVRNKPELLKVLSMRNMQLGFLPLPKEPARTEPVMRNLDGSVPLSPVGASVAVMPFSTIGQAEDDYIAHGLTADLQHDLTRCHDLFVSGRSSCLALARNEADAASVADKLGVLYVLQGTVRRDADRIRITAQLVEGSSGTVIWSERLDGTLNDLLDTEAEIAGAIASSLSLNIKNAQFDRRRHLQGDAATAYDWRLRGNRYLEQGGRDNLDRARRCFDRAIELEPESAAAHAGLSMCFGYECDLMLTADYDECLERHIELAERAVALDETDSRGHYAIACGLMLNGQFERADRHAARSVELNPSEYHNLCNRGYSLMALGRMSESVACFTQSLRRNPLAPNSCLLAVGLTEYLEENYGQSASALARMTGYQMQRASTLAAACAQVGYADAMRSAVQEFKRISTEIPIFPARGDADERMRFWHRAYPYLRDEAFGHMLEGLRKAELPV